MVTLFVYLQEVIGLLDVEAAYQSERSEEYPKWEILTLELALLSRKKMGHRGCRCTFFEDIMFSAKNYQKHFIGLDEDLKAVVKMVSFIHNGILKPIVCLK